MESLPDSVLLLIFSKLRYEDLCFGVRLVCSHWHQLSFDRDLWRHVIVPSHFSNRRVLLLLERVNEHVEELDLSNCDDVTQQGLLDLASMDFPKLKKLSVPITGTFGDTLFLRLSQACPILEELENVSPNLDDTCNPVLCQMLFPALKVMHDRPVANCGRIRRTQHLNIDTQKKTWWQRSITRLATACDQITSYKCCRGMEYLDSEGLDHVSQCFPNLSDLELRHCSLTDVGFKYFAQHNKVKGLKKLIMDKPGDLTDEALHIIADSCPNLQNLKLSRCALITNFGLLSLTSKCRKLSELHLNNSPSFLGSPKPKSDIDNSCLKSIADHCPRLVCFRLFYSSLVTSEGFQNLVTGCKYLQGLMLYECAHIDDGCLNMLLKLKFLRAFVLVNSNDVSPQGIINFVLHAPSLSRLSFYAKGDNFLGDLSEVAEKTYSTICSEDKTFRPNVVKYLTLRGVGSSFIQLVTVLCPSLMLLDLRSGCVVDSKCLINVIKNCEYLEELDVSSCDYECDSSLLKAISEYGAALRKISFGGSKPSCQIEDLYEVVQRCPSLRLLTLNVPNWPQLKEDELVEVVKKHHGQQCCVKVDKELDDDKSYFLDLHFTPLKFLHCISPAEKVGDNRISSD